jgi:pimeloyl-ACP methyl ester carboxylesterase
VVETATPAVTRCSVGAFEVNVWEEGEGSPLLYLHGYERHPGGAPFLRRLAEHHRVIAPEQPGYGTSAGFENVRDLLDLVLFYRSFIEDTVGEPVDVLGHSTGGMIAAEIAAIAPQDVRRLVLVDAFGLWLDDQPSLDPFGQASQVLRAKWHDPDQRPDPEPTLFVEDPEDPQGAVVTEAQNRATATKFMWPIADRGLRRRTQYIKAPTLIVHGASDGLLPVSYAEEMVSLLSDGRLHVVENAGHYPMIEQETEFIGVVEDFLAGGH